jgi:hypothetical protein
MSPPTITEEFQPHQKNSKTSTRINSSPQIITKEHEKTTNNSIKYHKPTFHHNNDDNPMQFSLSSSHQISPFNSWSLCNNLSLINSHQNIPNKCENNNNPLTWPMLFRNSSTPSSLQPRSEESKRESTIGKLGTTLSQPTPFEQLHTISAILSSQNFPSSQNLSSIPSLVTPTHIPTNSNMLLEQMLNVHGFKGMFLCRHFQTAYTYVR